MTAAASSYWLIAKITGKLITDGTSKTFYLSTRPVLDSTATTYYPIILSSPSLGQDHDRFGPSLKACSLTLLDAMNSFGVERKFSDFLQRYSFTDQAIEIYIQSTTLDTETISLPSANWKGKITDIQRSGAELTINAEARVFKRKPVTRKIDATTFSSAPISSLGKNLPLVLGSNVQVSPLQTSADGPATSNKWAYASTYANKFGNGGIQSYYVRNEASEFQAIVSASSTSSAVFGTAKSTTLNQSAEADIGILFQPLTTGNKILTHAAMWWYPMASFTDDVTFIYEIWEVADPNGLNLGSLGELKGTAQRAYASTAWSAEVEVEACFDKPILLKKNTVYVLVSKVREKTYSLTNYFKRSCNNTPTVCLKNDANSGWIGYGEWEIYHSLYGAVFTDTATPSSGYSAEGLGHSELEITQRSAPSGQTLCDLTKLELVLEINGLKDDGSGTITGAAGTVLSRPDYAIQALSYEWGGSSFAASSDWDFSAYTSTRTAYTTMPRSLGGVIEGGTFFEDAVRQICENSFSRVVQRNDGKLAVYTWGTHETSAYRLGPNDCRVENWEILDPSNVINSVQLSYAHSLIYFNDLRAAIDDVPGDYTGYLVLDSTDALGAVILGTSETLYGKRYLENQTLTLVNGSSTAQSIGYGYLAQFRHPPVYCDVIVPYYTYSSVQPMTVIEVLHPEFPCYFGSSYSSKLPDYSGTLVEVNSGYDYYRAECYRLQIESRSIEFASGSAPAIRWRCRVLTNAPHDPT